MKTIKVLYEGNTYYWVDTVQDIYSTLAIIVCPLSKKVLTVNVRLLKVANLDNIIEE